MAKNIGRSINVNDTASVPSGIALNASTAVTVAAANADRLYLDVNNNDGTNGFWLRLYPAAQDNLPRGIFISKKTGCRCFWTMPVDNVYTGELSAIAVAGTPAAYVTEY